MMLLIAHYYATRSAAQSIKQLVRCNQRDSAQSTRSQGCTFRSQEPNTSKFWVFELRSLTTIPSACLF